VRSALTYLRAKVGTWETLGKSLRFEPCTIIHVAHGRRAVSPTMAFRIARFAKVSIDGLLAGKFPPHDTCAHCGHGKEEKR
jgi:hypothetical protein